MAETINDPSHLETIGKFIGTYGLAVFLVVYYAVKLYPELRAERGEWIRQITRLRQLVDPATRPLTRDQAKTILQLAGDALADRVRLLTEGRSIAMAPGNWSGSDEVRVFVGNREFSFNPQDQMDKDAWQREFVQLTTDIQRALEDEMRRSRENFREQLKYVSEMGRRDAYRLALLRFGRSSLEFVWTKAYDATVPELDAYLEGSLESHKRHAIDEVRQFFLKHPGFRDPRDNAFESFLSNIRLLSGQELAAHLKAVFDRHVEECLAQLEASDSDI